MFGPWFNVAMLAVRSQQVIGLRLAEFARGGAGARREATRMVTEKVDAGTRAAMKLASGASLDRVVEDYRAVVDANVKRLSRGRAGRRSRG